MRIELARSVITLATPLIAGIAGGLIFALLSRPHVMRHSLLFCAIYTAVSSYELAITPGEYLYAQLALLAIYLVSLLACAAIGAKIASALKNQDARTPTANSI